MHKLIQTIGLGLTFTLSACSSMNNHYSQTVHSWQGGQSQTLAQRWGRPDSNIKSPNGNTILVYKTETYGSDNNTSGSTVNVKLTPEGHPMLVNTPTINVGGNRGTNISCLTVFEINSKRTIVDAQQKGNGCFGNEQFAQRMSNPAAKTGV